VFIVDTIKLSHRFAGPIYRMQQTIRSLARGGAFTPIKFREFDFWQNMAEDFNQMVERLTAAKPAESVDAETVKEAEEREPALATR
jgi:nitrogen fixation/metabolism regulation signal transduction histidine kinase